MGAGGIDGEAGGGVETTTFILRRNDEGSGKTQRTECSKAILRFAKDESLKLLRSVGNNNVALPIIAIVGRPNVGKSTLYNRLAGRRMAIVSDVPGTTRDRVSTDAEWMGKRFLLLDTGGIEDRPGDVLWEDVKSQTRRALDDADGVILVVDALTGPMAADEDAADMVRRSGKPCVVAVNKADNPSRELGTSEFYSLGAGEPYAISAYHGSGISDLMNGLIDVMVNKPEYVREGRSIRIAIVGRPNVGKSAIFNALTGEDRSIVSPVPGTTRDSIDSRFEYDGKDITFLDTAGLRRRGKTEPGIEKYSALRSIAAIERSHLCLVVLSADDFVTQQDTHVAGYVDEAARAAVVVVNKWDLAPKGKAAKADAERVIRERMKFLPDIPILFTSTVTGEGIEGILPALMLVHEEFTKRVPRSELSRCIFQALGDNPLPYSGRLHPRIFRVIQERTAPPSFVFNARHADLIHFSYRRYLENRLRAEFGFKGSPIVFTFRTGRND